MLGNIIRVQLNTDMGRDYFERYWLGGGDLKLTQSEFGNIVSSLSSATPTSVKAMGDNIGKLYSFYEINEGYAEAFGSAWIVYDKDAKNRVRS